MPEICHRVGIAAPRRRVYEELATKGGLVEFCTPVEGDPERAEIELFFGGGMAEQTEQTFRDRILLRASGASLDVLASCLVRLAHLADCTQFHVVYAGQFRAAASRFEQPCVRTLWRICASKSPTSPTEPGESNLAQESQDEMGPRLSGKTRLFLAGNTLSMLGTGLVLPFMIIYLHQARGIALPVVGGMLAAGAATGLVVVMVCGALMDRVGARLVLGMVLLGQVVAEVALAWAHNTLTAWPAVLIYGATWTPMFAGISTMLHGLTPEPALTAARLRGELCGPEHGTRHRRRGRRGRRQSPSSRDLPGALPCQRPLLSSFRGPAARAAEPAANEGSQ